MKQIPFYLKSQTGGQSRTDGTGLEIWWHQADFTPVGVPNGATVELVIRAAVQRLEDLESRVPAPENHQALVALNAAVALTTEQIERARACDIFHEVTRRGFVRKLRWRGMGATKEVVGPCPVCGGTDRFSVHLRKQVFNCRGCKRGGNVIAFVEWYDRVSFREAVIRLVGNEGPAPVVRRRMSHDCLECLLAVLAAH